MKINSIYRFVVSMFSKIMYVNMVQKKKNQIYKLHVNVKKAIYDFICQNRISTKKISGNEIIYILHILCVSKRYIKISVWLHSYIIKTNNCLTLSTSGHT